MFSTQSILLSIAAPFVLMGLLTLTGRFLKRPSSYVIYRTIQVALVLCGLYCIAAGIDLLQSHWVSPLEEQAAQGFGSAPAKGRGAGGVILLAILYWPWATIIIGTGLVGMAASNAIERTFKKTKQAFRTCIASLMTSSRPAPPPSAAKSSANRMQKAHQTGPAATPATASPSVPTRAAMIAGAQSIVRIEEVDRIIQGYSATLQRPDVILGLDPADEKILPHPKDRTRAALILAITSTKDPGMLDALRVAYSLLAEFQHGMGQLPAHQVKANLLHDRTRVTAELGVLTQYG